MARVRGVIAFSSRATSMLKVRGSTSTSTGLAPASTMTLSVAAKVSGVVMTSSPGLSSSASSARCNPAVAEVSANACGAPRYCFRSSSKRLVRGPVVIQPDLRHSTTSAMASGLIDGRENGRKSSLIRFSSPGTRRR